MRQSFFFSFSVILFVSQFLIACLASYFLSKWSSLYRLPVTRSLYWAITAGSLFLIYFRRSIMGNYLFDNSYLAGLIKFLLNLAYIWTTSLIVIVVVLGLIYIVKILLTIVAKLKNKLHNQPVKPAKVEPDIDRRTFLKRTAQTLPVLSFGLSAHGVFDGDSKITVTRRQLALPDFPQEFDGFKIAQITDSHMGFYFGLDKLNRVLELIRNEKPHLLVITGDFIDEIDLLEPALDLLSPVASQLPYGAYFCWGNHEYFRNFNRIRKTLDESPITVLRNNNQLVVPGNSPLYLLGVDYPFVRKGESKKNLRENYLAKAMNGLPPNATPILITHHSDFIEEAFAADIPFTLAGHTHGGQITLFGKSLLPGLFKYVYGIYTHNDCLAYVSPGAGHWLPFRLNCPAEVAVFTLTNKKS